MGGIRDASHWVGCQALAQLRHSVQALHRAVHVARVPQVFQPCAVLCKARVVLLVLGQVLHEDWSIGGSFWELQAQQYMQSCLLWHAFFFLLL